MYSRLLLYCRLQSRLMWLCFYVKKRRKHSRHKLEFLLEERAYLTCLHLRCITNHYFLDFSYFFFSFRGKFWFEEVEATEKKSIVVGNVLLETVTENLMLFGFYPNLFLKIGQKFQKSLVIFSQNVTIFQNNKQNDSLQ